MKWLISGSVSRDIKHLGHPYDITRALPWWSGDKLVQLIEHFEA